MTVRLEAGFYVPVAVAVAAFVARSGRLYGAVWISHTCAGERRVRGRSDTLGSHRAAGVAQHRAAASQIDASSFDPGRAYWGSLK
jgi:hypothetical protein